MRFRDRLSKRSNVSIPTKKLKKTALGSYRKANSVPDCRQHCDMGTCRLSSQMYDRACQYKTSPGAAFHTICLSYSAPCTTKQQQLF